MRLPNHETATINNISGRWGYDTIAFPLLLGGDTILDFSTVGYIIAELTDLKLGYVTKQGARCRMFLSYFGIKESELGNERQVVTSDDRGVT